MKKISLLLFAPLFLCAKVHYAKVEPYESVTIKSAVSGLVLEATIELEGSKIEEKRIIHIDDALDMVNLEASNKNVILLQEMLDINVQIAESLKGTVNRQKSYFNRISKLSTASKTQKDSAYSQYVSAKTQYLSTKEKIVSYKKQMLDIQYKIAQLKDMISKKSVLLKDKYLYKLMVHVGDFVVPGSSLAQINDASRAKLVLFLETDEMKNLSTKAVYIDDKKTVFKVDKVWKITDEKFISSYRAEIYIPAPVDAFSKLVKVEIK